MRLWAHEAMRVFHDRLVDDSDRGWFCSLLAGMLPKHMGSAFEDVFASEPEQLLSPAVAARSAAAAAGGADGIAEAARSAEQKAAAAALRSVLFADFLQPGSGGAKAAKYQEAREFGKLLKRVEDSLADYNEQVGGHMPACLLCSRWLRVLQLTCATNCPNASARSDRLSVFLVVCAAVALCS